MTHWDRPAWTTANISNDPQDWTPLEWILFTQPFGLGHLAQRFKTGSWGFNALQSPNSLYTYMMFSAAQGAAYTAVGVAVIAPEATMANVRQLAGVFVYKRFAGPPVASVAGPMLLWPNVLTVEGFLTPSTRYA